MGLALKALCSVACVLLIACGSVLSPKVSDAKIAAFGRAELLRPARFERDLTAFAKPLIVADDSYQWLDRPCGRVVCRDFIFSVEIALRPERGEKEIGLWWDSDLQSGRQMARATYAGMRADGLERWKVQVNSGQSEGRLEYSAFVVINGVTYWDPFNNHRPLGGVTPERPLSLADPSWQRGEPESEAVLRVEATLFPWSENPVLTIWSRWSDESKFTPSSCSRRAAQIWSCERAVASRGENGYAKLQYFVEGNYDGSVVRDDNQGRNFETSPYPAIKVEMLGVKVATWASSRSVSGVLGFLCRLDEDSQGVSVEMRLDSETDWHRGSSLFFSTVTVNPGKHAVLCRAHKLGTAFISIASADFDVDSSLKPGAGTALPWLGFDAVDAVDAGERFERTLAFDGQSHAYVQLQSGTGMRLARVHLNGAGVGAIDYFESYGGANIAALAVMDSGEVWGWLGDSDELVAWHAQGNRRMDVGTQGRVKLGLGNGAGRRSLVAAGDRLAVTSPWQRKIEIFSSQGILVAQYHLDESYFPSLNEGRAPVLAWRQAKLWWFDSINLIRFALSENTVEPEEVTVVRRPFLLSPVAMAPLSQGGFVVAASDPAALYTLSSLGEWRNAWFGTGRSIGMIGDIVSPSAIGVDAEGSVIVGMDGSAELSRFILSEGH